MVEILQAVAARAAADAGCARSGVFAALDEEASLLYQEVWNSEEALSRHIRSPLFSRILSAMDLAAREPEVRFHEVSSSKGMEWVEALRRIPPAPLEPSRWQEGKPRIEGEGGGE
jgi:quinol monooxygenase YgiN